MMEDKEFGLNDVVEMKKQHPCGTNAGKLFVWARIFALNVKVADIVL